MALAAGAVLIVWAATTAARTCSTRPGSAPAPAADRPVEPDHHEPERDGHRGADQHDPDGVGGPALARLPDRVAFVVAVGALVVLGVVDLVNRLRDHSLDLPSAPQGFEPERGSRGEVALELGPRRERQLDALHHGTPRNAIVACWLELEDTVRASGVVPQPHQTAEELTRPVLRALDVDRGRDQRSSPASTARPGSPGTR